jgi:DNA-binding Lrp family transcriptional regulator
MRKILVFIKCELGKTYDVAAALVDSKLCPTVDSISGDYDLFVQFMVADDDDIGRIIAEQVQMVAGIRDTKTIICFNPFSRDDGVKKSNG